MKLRLLVVLLTMTLNQLIASTNERFAWHSDLNQARVLAMTESKPMLVVFRCEP